MTGILRSCLTATALTLALAAHLPAQDTSRYHDADALSSALDELESEHGRVVRVFEIARSPGGAEIRAVRLGAGDGADTRPALLVVAGAYGPHLIGTEVALHAARSLAAAYGSDPAVTGLLDRSTVYVIPRANPDAAAAFFEAPRRERLRNAEPYDDDRDTDVDEDGPDDLDGNGMITMMRVLDPTGGWLADPEDPELMREADPAKGETGTHRVYVEGVDDDGDERWNEDPPGGVDVNRNLPHGYEFFGEATGLHQVAAPEARAIAQFFIDHPNVAVVYALGPQDNLLEAWKHERQPRAAGDGEGDGERGGRGSRRPLESILEEDEPYFAGVAERFREISGLASGPKSAPSSGDVLASAYYDMGRWSFGSRGWWIPDEADAGGEPEGEEGDEAPAPPAEGEGPQAAGGRSGGGAADDGKDPLERERRELRWLKEHAPGSFVEWTEVRHPDFPDRTVEVGGFAPFARLNPPESEIDSVLARQQRFIAALAGLLPSIALRDVEVEALSSGVYRIEVRVVNDGYLPTLSALGERVRWPRRVRVEVRTDGQEIAAGEPVRLLGPLTGSGGYEELEWVVVGDAGSRVTIRAASPVAGESSQTVTLR